MTRDTAFTLTQTGSEVIPGLVTVDRFSGDKLAYARHGLAYDRDYGSFDATFVFEDRACTKPIGWQAGLLVGGARFDEYQLVLTCAAQASVRAA